MAHLVVLSHYQAKPLLAARRALLDMATISPDLNRTMVAVRLSERGVILPGGELLAWHDVARIAASENSCFLVTDGEIQPVQVFSETTNWMRSLYPTAGAPTTLVAGFPMHRIKDTDPYEDTLKKIAALAPVTGNVLDTTTGLGYTAIEAARTAQRVTTLELDPAALEIARLNPWSQDLFENPRIEVMIADAIERIREFADEAFTCVLHDPPTFSLAGELYSEDFYRQLYRVLAPRGRLFHYVGDPTSKLGRRMTTSVVQRLQESGFRRVIRKAEAFGVVASK
jgi:predicted methyltransferase